MSKYIDRDRQEEKNAEKNIIRKLVLSIPKLIHARLRPRFAMDDRVERAYLVLVRVMPESVTLMCEISCTSTAPTILGADEKRVI